MWSNISIYTRDETMYTFSWTQSALGIIYCLLTYNLNKTEFREYG